MHGIALGRVAGQNDTMSDNLPQLLTGLEKAEQIMGELAGLVLSGTAEFVSTWDIANRVCDRYYLAKAA